MMMMKSPHWRLFPKYATLIIALVGGGLIVSGALSLLFSWREIRSHMVALQAEKAQGAATRIEQYVQTSVTVLMFGNLDPVAQGLVANLARPEANVTGVLIAADGTLGGKRLELLREAVPRASRVALLAPDDPNFGHQLDETRRAPEALKLALEVTTVHARDYPAAFAALAARLPDALVVGAHSFFMVDRKPIIELAARHRLPAVYEWPEQVRDGGLLAYGTNLDALYARLADDAAQLFAGRKASDLPVAYRLVVNRRTASALGLTLSPGLLLRADEVIE